MQIRTIFYICSLFLWPALMLGVSVPKNTVLKFSHQLHWEEEELECLDCHADVEESETAADWNMPDHELCANCHEEAENIADPAPRVMSEGCDWCHVSADVWELERVDRQLIYSHAQHLSLEDAALSCDDCHADVNRVTLAGPDQMAGMSQCMDCHDDALAPNDCNLCHTQPRYTLLPADHTFDFAFSHKFFARGDESTCMTCHDEQYCQDCHEGGFVVAAREQVSDHYAPMDPEASHTPQIQILKRVHMLNYRMVHGVDAKSKLASCATCHDTGTFCTDCHTEESSLDRLRPVWHGGTDWGALVGAVGSGGGRHADMARRDMELCVACHDDVVDDPICLMCHIDRNPGLGNDPRTHTSRFRDDDGSWHEDPLSLCFDCHRDSRQSGVGFCGYCHGPDTR